MRPVLAGSVFLTNALGFLSRSLRLMRRVLVLIVSLVSTVVVWHLFIVNGVVSC